MQMANSTEVLLKRFFFNWNLSLESSELLIGSSTSSVRSQFMALKSEIGSKGTITANEKSEQISSDKKKWKTTQPFNFRNFNFFYILSYW